MADAQVELPFSKADRRLLYSRYHGLRNKAKAKGIPFVWETFEDFAVSVYRLMPVGYQPDRYRMEFHKEALEPGGAGYCEQTMQILPIKKRLLEDRLAPAPSAGCRQACDCLLVAYLARELMAARDGEERDLEEIWQEAQRQAA